LHTINELVKNVYWYRGNGIKDRPKTNVLRKFINYM
jgi:hypothetical protein